MTQPTQRNDGGSHRDVTRVLKRLGRWPVMWRVDVPDVGTLTCYGARWCIVHVMDYVHGGFDIYVPPTSSLLIDDTLDALERAAQSPRYEIQALPEEAP